jgi:hypothetical protein
MVKITTNNQPRNLDGNYDDDGFVYKGWRYSLSEFTTTSGMWGAHAALDSWDGYLNESMWSGIVVKIVNSDQIIVGSYYSE